MLYWIAHDAPQRSPKSADVCRGGDEMQPVFAVVAACALALLTACPSHAQGTDADARSFPSRAVRMIVPFPPGGPTDLMARVFAQKLNEHWGQPIVVENRAGGNSAIGARQVASAAADGYTLLVAMDTTLVMNPITTSDLPYNAAKDFAPISLVAQNTSLLIVRADDGPKTVRELIARAKANPGKLNYGAGTITTRLAGYLFGRMAGIDTVFIPYKGSAEVVQGLLTKSIDFSVDGVSASLPLIQQGKLRALAKLNGRPLAALPDLQHLAVAADLPGLGDISTWSGLVAPAGTPAAIVEKIRAAVAQVAADPDVKAKLDKFGISAVSTTPAEFDSYIRHEVDRWSNVFKESGIKLE
jgi:tripartite-type tricarboxylate transporter receptor subunit TctC